MKFAELLQAAIGRSEIPLRFEPGAEEAVAKPIIEILQAWLEAHRPSNEGTPVDEGRGELISELLDEISGVKDLPD